MSPSQPPERDEREDPSGNTDQGPSSTKGPATQPPGEASVEATRADGPDSAADSRFRSARERAGGGAKARFQKIRERQEQRTQEREAKREGVFGPSMRCALLAGILGLGFLIVPRQAGFFLAPELVWLPWYFYATGIVLLASTFGLIQGQRWGATSGWVAVVLIAVAAAIGFFVLDDRRLGLLGLIGVAALTRALVGLPSREE